MNKVIRWHYLIIVLQLLCPTEIFNPDSIATFGTRQKKGLRHVVTFAMF